MNLTLLVPDLLRPPAPLAEIRDALPPMPAMRRLLGRADRVKVPGNGIMETLCWLTALESLPAGALTALAAGEDPGTQWWMRVDPVHLVPDTDGLRLIRGEALEVTDDEAATLSVFLATELDLPLRAAAPGHWFTAYPTLGVTTHPPDAALGRRIESYMPEGEDARALRAWVNDAQMLLHAHPVNLRRADRDQPSINSVWPWGGGVLREPKTWPFERTYADDPLLAGIALWHGSQADAVPVGLAQVSGSGPCLVRLDALHEASRLGDVERWLVALAAIERDWFVPARDMLASGQLDSLTVLDAAGTQYTMRPAMRWRFWRRDGELETD